jgi:parallel beta-helix repeat protein
MNKLVTITSLILIYLISIFSGCVDDSQNDKLDEIYVNLDGSADFISIQDAINASKDNVFIYVRSGTYYESIIIDRPINLIGEGRDKTIISGKYLDYNVESIITINTEFCKVQGFMLKESTNSNLDGIKAAYSSNNSIINNSIIGLDHGIYLSSRSDYNLVKNNLVQNNTYGIRIQLSEHNNVIENTVINNSRGVYCCCSAMFNEIHFNNFYENRDYSGIETTGLVNYWNNNYWDDYTGVDDDNDGFGDTPYNIPRNDNKDSNPLMNPIE